MLLQIKAVQGGAGGLAGDKTNDAPLVVDGNYFVLVFVGGKWMLLLQPMANR